MVMCSSSISSPSLLNLLGNEPRDPKNHMVGLIVEHRPSEFQSKLSYTIRILSQIEDLGSFRCERKQMGVDPPSDRKSS